MDGGATLDEVMCSRPSVWQVLMRLFLTLSQFHNNNNNVPNGIMEQSVGKKTFLH
jgi:hypothetical protein